MEREALDAGHDRIGLVDDVIGHRLALQHRCRRKGDHRLQCGEVEQLQAAAAGTAARVVAVPALYPAGGEKQLIRVLTGVEIPYGKLGADYGVQCFNVGTAHAVYRAFIHGEPLISRIVTLTGNCETPGNWEVAIGTPVEDLLALARPKADTDRYLMGGPMMGFAMPRLDVPVVKGTNCIISASPRLFPPAPPEQPCIRCTE